MTISNTDNIIDSRVLLERIEELREMRAPYSASWNMPGYMPDSEAATFCDADDAREYIAEAMEREADQLDEQCEADAVGTNDPRVPVARRTAQQLRETAEQLRKMSGDDDAAEFGVTIGGLHYWIACDDSPTAGLDDDDAEELRALESFAEELRGYGDFEHGEALIRDDYFAEYAEELARDCGMIKGDTTGWPLNCIDWERAADELKADYVSAEFGGVTYWMRA